MIRPLVATAWLAGELDDPGIRIVDTRWYLDDGDLGRRQYEVDHIPGAVFLDLEHDLSGRRGPGRHPLPDGIEFAATLGVAGIGNHHHVVVYDQGPGSIAARLWWMLRHVGHHRVSVLDGGYHLWCESDHETSNGTPAHPPEIFESGPPANQTIDRQTLLARLGTVQLLDARSGERYRGDIEPVDPVAGHIPTSISAPITDNVDGDGRFKTPEQLARQFSTLGIDDEGSIVSSCGSGVTACHNILALHLAGFPEATLYPGSWSDWSSSSYPVAKGSRPGSLPART